MALNFKDTAITLAMILVFVLYFAYFASLVFYTSFEGIVYTPNLAESYWQFLILLTTENYPFIALTSYQSHWISVLFFWIFIVIGIFYLQSVLLALVFENYKKRVEELSQTKLDRRLHYIEIFYDQFDIDGDGYLAYSEAKDFFEFVLDLNYRKRKHRKTFVKIIKIVDPERY